MKSNSLGVDRDSVDGVAYVTHYTEGWIFVTGTIFMVAERDMIFVKKVRGKDLVRCRAKKQEWLENRKVRED